MSTTTSGQISVTPVRIVADTTLDELHQAVTSLDLRYAGKIDQSGWGSVRDATDNLLGQVMTRSISAGQPEPKLSPEIYPEQVRARLYWDEPDRALQRALGETLEVAATRRLHAADVTITAGSRDGEFLALLGERNQSRLKNYVIPTVEKTVDLVDPRGQVLREDNDLEFGDDDFFRWILYRATHDPDLGSDLTVERIRAMSNQDISYRPTNLSHGVELDRPELLALLIGTLNRFGPSKFVVSSKDLKLRLSLELAKTGQFSIYRGDSEYDLGPGENLTPEEEGLRLLQDAAFEILPELRRLHNADGEWRETHRDEFKAEARDLLRGILDKL
ncbi:hypothetical protein [Allobranchiibius huperziae]|uniref:Uncharacterized protein n=1 Tax=Allobranchiibius huperziae TaxID=1874116 RepID=A0A853DAL6_9MICO|nr:hypothetical protein [Allobranchiibius huperziae]NYJ73637.1 hypothetical protein [Allobranchiibius huperziae]